MKKELTYQQLKAITTFQQIYRLKRRALLSLHDSLESIYTTLLSVSNGINTNHQIDVLNTEQYVQQMENTEALVAEFNILPDAPSLHDLKENPDLPHQVSYLHYQVTQLVKECGASTCMDVIELLSHGNAELFIEPQFERMLNLLNLMFVPTSVKLSRTMSYDIKVVKYPSFSESLVVRLNGAEVTIPFCGKSLIMKGYFKDDPLSTSRIRGTMKTKFDALYNEVIQRHGRDPLRITRYLEQISLRDFLALDKASLLNLVSNDMKQLDSWKLKPKSHVLSEFLQAPFRKKLSMMALFLVDSDTHDHVQSILSTVRSRKELLTQLHTKLHWTLQKILSEQLKVVHENPKVVDDSVLPYESRIEALKCSESIKKKALAKLKEINSSKDGNEKAIQYLDGLLRIPFGTYRREPILDFITQFKQRLVGLRSDLEETYSWTPVPVSDDEEDSEDTPVSPDPSANTQEVLQVLKTFPLDTEMQLDEAVERLSSHKITSLTNVVSDWYSFKPRRLEYLDFVKLTLDKCMYGQEEAKRSIESIVAQWINGEMNGVVFGFQGFPGTGKTTLAKRGIAQCLIDENGNSRPFYFTGLGGKKGSSFLLGHGYTYVGSQPGKLAEYLQDGRIMNPILYFDELDKVSNTPEGDEIVRILTHLLDPSQNDHIEDRYFGIDLDLSKALIILSYNDSSSIDRILMDRIHEINFTPYNKSDKVHIARDYVMPSIMSSHGFSKDSLKISDETLGYLVEHYTCEAGVRDLKDKLTDVVREINLRRIYNEKDYSLPFTISSSLVDEILKAKNKVMIQEIPSKPQVGWVNGLYATNIGFGGITVIQAFVTPSEQKYALELTGKLGDVMKESVMCAKTISWSMLGGSLRESVNKEWRENALHVHFPAAGTSKDGPSAGAAITTAIISYFSKLPVRNYIAMTGEIDLRGNVGPIGGLRCKIEGALRAGVRLVLIPRKNEVEYQDFAESLPFDKIRVFAVDNISQVVRVCLEGASDTYFTYPHTTDDETTIAILRYIKEIAP